MDFHQMAKEKGWGKEEQIAHLIALVEAKVDGTSAEQFLSDIDGYDDGLEEYNVLAQWPEGDTWHSPVRAASFDDAETQAIEEMADSYGVDMDNPEDLSAFGKAVKILEIN